MLPRSTIFASSDAGGSKEGRRGAVPGIGHVGAGLLRTMAKARQFTHAVVTAREELQACMTKDEPGEHPNGVDPGDDR